ncbi:hypothetical protein EW146_g2955 [Bondarzewia mesenterica]|uniref:RlpA-like protein double-psi beta-barrel domain-containing protein n=1 Tax=Bondarzewia mesenterica TaxID=1095465 RepID=A0A4S4LZ31_9AGAM|nr:hypothetical protein EW146_g2955 [Bondarzewia mesenterica]
MTRIVFLFYIALYFQFSLAATTKQDRSHSAAELKYSISHSLGDNYVFDARDGWQSVNITNMKYTYSAPRNIQDAPPASAYDDHGYHSSWKRSSKKYNKTKWVAKTKHGSKGLGNAITNALESIFKGMKGVGQAEPVTITWYADSSKPFALCGGLIQGSRYTGHDLENPSCWPESKWAPTDASFACALTMEGWQSKPQCFRFLELCNSPKKCVFVRVVDTCAGCAKGSKHVDLTKAAFGQLADFDEGILMVQMRMATEPDDWSEKLWGPKAK